MTPEEQADAAKSADFARRILRLAARQQRATRLSDRAAVAAMIDAAAKVMSGAGCTHEEIAEHLRTMARSVEAQAGVLRNLQ